MAASATARQPKPAVKPKLWMPILPTSYTKSLLQPPKLIPVRSNPASHSFWTKRGDSITLDAGGYAAGDIPLQRQNGQVTLKLSPNVMYVVLR